MYGILGLLACRVNWLMGGAGVEATDRLGAAEGPIAEVDKLADGVRGEGLDRRVVRHLPGAARSHFTYHSRYAVQTRALPVAPLIATH
jgi:hypothetical protein